MKIFLLSQDNIIVNSFKNSFDNFYFLNDWEDAHFRVPDFAPDLIIINEDLLDEGQERSLKEYVSQIPVFYLLKEENAGLREEEFVLRKPLSFEGLRSTIEDLFSQLKKQ